MRNVLRDLLETGAEKYNTRSFIAGDPVAIPHRFSRRHDIEIAAFFAAVLAWGQRPVIIRKCTELLGLMHDAPYDFIMHHRAKDLLRMHGFRHRTFNGTDLRCFITSLRKIYKKYGSMEPAFSEHMKPGDQTTERAISGFHKVFFSAPGLPARCRKHLPVPENGSACKRLNMFLRWMSRQDQRGVDFGIWRSIPPSRLVCPVDVHVGRTARKLGLLKRKQTDWNAAMELTSNLRAFDPADPVKYDFALFGLGLESKEE